jgi:hypothetical protein
MLPAHALIPPYPYLSIHPDWITQQPVTGSVIDLASSLVVRLKVFTSSLSNVNQ